jgi:hypothetical protein
MTALVDTKSERVSKHECNVNIGGDLEEVDHPANVIFERSEDSLKKFQVLRCSDPTCGRYWGMNYKNNSVLLWPERHFFRFEFEPSSVVRPLIVP